MLVNVPKGTDTSISGLIADYLAEERQATETNQRSVKHYSQLRDKLSYFEQFAAEKELTDVREITADNLREFKSGELFWLSQPKEQNGVAVSTTRARLRVVKDWLLWCEELGVYQTPGYLLTFGKVEQPRIDPDTQPKNGNGNPTFTADEIRQLWELASERNAALSAARAELRVAFSSDSPGELLPVSVPGGLRVDGI